MAGSVSGAAGSTCKTAPSDKHATDVEDEESAAGDGDDRAPSDHAAVAGLLSTPGQAAAASALSFTVGAAVLLLAAWFITGYRAQVAVVVAHAALCCSLPPSSSCGCRSSSRARLGRRAPLTGVWASSRSWPPSALLHPALARSRGLPPPPAVLHPATTPSPAPGCLRAAMFHDAVRPAHQRAP